MKKLLIAFLCVAMVLAFAGCSNNDRSVGESATNGENQITQNNNSGHSTQNPLDSDSSGNNNPAESNDPNGNTQSGETMTDRYLNIRFITNGDDVTYKMTVYNNSSVQYLLNHIPSGEMGTELEDNKAFAHHTSSTLRSCPTNESLITSIKAGDVFLASGGQLRMYFTDVENVNYSMTKIGYIEDTTGLTDAVEAAYQRGSNYWGGVYDVYYMISLGRN